MKRFAALFLSLVVLAPLGCVGSPNPKYPMGITWESGERQKLPVVRDQPWWRPTTAGVSHADNPWEKFNQPVEVVSPLNPWGNFQAPSLFSEDWVLPKVAPQPEVEKFKNLEEM